MASDGSNNMIAITRESCMISYSTNTGTTWNTYRGLTMNSIATINFNGIVYGGGRFVVYGRNSVIGVTENNGVSWEWSGIGGHYEIIDMGYGDGFFVGAGLLSSTTVYPTPIVIWSPDGKNWTQRAVPHNMKDTSLIPKQRINYLNKIWMIASDLSIRGTNIWSAPYPYDISSQFQIPTTYIGRGINKFWIKAT
jgi:hypothetical protein